MAPVNDRLKMQLVILPTLVLAGCVAGEPLLPAPETPAVADGDHMAIVHYGAMDLAQPGIVEDFARADIVVVEMTFLWNPVTPPDLVTRMKQANPDVKVVGYVNAHGSWLKWGDPGETNPYGRDWYAATRPFWSHTTTGDTMMSWKGKVLLDILDPACRDAMVGVLAEHWRTRDNVPDGIFWDAFNDWLWVPEVAGVEGDMDLDDDLLPHREDEDELQAYRDASDDLIRAVRREIGAHVIQIANGNRAVRDSVFAGLIDGMMYEHFPDVNFLGDSMNLALDLSRPDNLFAARRWPITRNGGPWLILSNKFHYGYATTRDDYQQLRRADLNRAVALLTGTHVAYHPPEQTTQYGWPDVPIDLGAPLGPATRTGSQLRREFDRGSVLIDLAGGYGIIPFAYQIVESGRVVQEFVPAATGP